jgi:hypothetical protein
MLKSFRFLQLSILNIPRSSIDPSDGLDMMSNLEIFFKSFSFFLKRYNDYLNSNLSLHLELGLDLQLEYQMCTK